MTIRPIDFNGMIQNTQEVGQTKSHEDSAPMVQQNVVARDLEEQSELSATQVHEQEDAAAEGELDADREGDGRGYKTTAKKKHKKEKKEKISDGVVRIKSSHQPFDMKI